MQKLLSTKTAFTIISVLATAVGAFGGMPPAPKVLVTSVQRFPLLQWLLLFVLIWQGGGGQDVSISAMGTLLVYVIYRTIGLFDTDTVKIVTEDLS